MVAKSSSCDIGTRLAKHWTSGRIIRRTDTKGVTMMFLNANRAFAAFASLTLTALVMAATIIPASPTLMI